MHLDDSDNLRATDGMALGAAHCSEKFSTIGAFQCLWVAFSKLPRDDS
jgi:hypothetical protein